MQVLGIFSSLTLLYYDVLIMHFFIFFAVFYSSFSHLLFKVSNIFMSNAFIFQLFASTYILGILKFEGHINIDT
jgi:hypothetical protein